MEAVISGSLRDAAIERNMAVEKAQAEFDLALARAARVAAMRQKVIDRQWDNARSLARRVAGIRRGLWQQHHALESDELRVRLAVHEFRLSPVYASQRLSTASNRAELWYVRMITAELVRRGDLPRPERKKAA